MNDDWLRVTRAHPCPICGRPNGEHKSAWCLRMRNGRGTLCMWVKSQYPVNSGHGYMHWNDAPQAPRAERHGSPAPIPKVLPGPCSPMPTFELLSVRR